MRTSKCLVPTMTVLAFCVLPVLAGDAASGKPAATGKDDAVQGIEAATTKQVEILTGLLSRVPEQAQPAIEKAIAAARAGRDTAIAALTTHGGAGDDGSAGLTSAGNTGKPDNSGNPQEAGLERARTAVADGFEKSTTTLQGLLGTVPSETAPKIRLALARIDQARTVALQNLDSLIAGERPGHPTSSAHAVKPDHPSRPDRPERAERPERPQTPQRPERPQVPDHPSPPNG